VFYWPVCTCDNIQVMAIFFFQFGGWFSEIGPREFLEQSCYHLPQKPHLL
jgi:hypothetical protein